MRSRALSPRRCRFWRHQSSMRHRGSGSFGESRLGSSGPIRPSAAGIVCHCRLWSSSWQRPPPRLIPYERVIPRPVLAVTTKWVAQAIPVCLVALPVVGVVHVSPLDVSPLGLLDGIHGHIGMPTTPSWLKVHALGACAVRFLPCLAVSQQCPAMSLE